MDEFIQIKRAKPKRRSRYARQKICAEFLAQDVASLEARVEALLKNLERAIRLDTTDQERNCLHEMVSDIRNHLKSVEA